MNDRDVFINCPFSPDYSRHFQAIVFAVIRSGFTPRCARENDDGGEVRFDKICRIISESRYGIHDISKTEPVRARACRGSICRSNLVSFWVRGRSADEPSHVRRP